MFNVKSTRPSVLSGQQRAWRSLTLRRWVLCLLIASECILLAVIAILLVLSRKNNGFVKIGTQATNDQVLSYDGTIQDAKPLLWTSLPALIFTFYRIFRGSVIASLVVETPYMELYRTVHGDRTTKLGQSAYLDYRTYIAPVALLKAFKNRHVFLGTCMLVSFLVSIIAVPLAANLFADGMEFDTTITDITIFSSYVSPENMSIVDYAAVMDAVSASWIYGAAYPSGTDGTYSFPRIAPTEPTGNYTIKVNTSSPQLTLDCAVVESPITSFDQATTDSGQARFSADDRGCTVSGVASFGSAWNRYLRAFETHSCDEASGGTRLFYLYATSSTGSLEPDRSAIVSCIPAFWNVTGTLTVSSTGESTKTRVEIPAFSATSQEVVNLPAFSEQHFVDSMIGVGTLNPSAGADTDTPNRLAELVVRDIAAKKLVMDEDNIIDSIKTIVPAIYTMMNVQYYFPNLADAAQQEGELRIPENRLHVVLYTAAAMMTILGILIVETICLIVYVEKHPTILTEEPVGLIGAANMLQNSNIPHIIGDIHQKHDFDGRLHREIIQPETEGSPQKSWLSALAGPLKKSKKSYADDALLERRCYVVESQTSPLLQIIVEDSNDSEQRQPQLVSGHYNFREEHSASMTDSPKTATVASNTETQPSTLYHAAAQPRDHIMSQHRIPRKALR